MDQPAATTRPVRLLDLLGSQVTADPAALSRAMVRLAHLAAAEHRLATAKLAATASPHALRPVNGLTGQGQVPPLDRAVAVIAGGAVITEDDR